MPPGFFVTSHFYFEQKEMFAQKYLEKNQPSVLIPEAPDFGLGMCIVIPCLREPEILNTLESLLTCDLPAIVVEVIIVVNHSQTAPSGVKKINRETRVVIENRIAKNKKSGLVFHVVGPVELPQKWAGAGLARKKGMDEAVRRFNVFDKKDGIIVSLDADTLVDRNYLMAVFHHFKNNPKHAGATITFKHQTEGLDSKHLEGIQLYEKYLWYYKEAMRFAGYPYPMFTVGSAFAVTAGAYVKRGGMNRRQAGEDFYFLQNLAHFGKVGEITETTVHPSARLSDRVPFGTGPILRKWLEGKEDLEKTYNFQAFKDLKAFFDEKDKLFRIEDQEYVRLISGLPQPVFEFLLNDEFWNDLEDLNKNCTNQKTFQNRFFQKFNAFKILKFLNFGHEKFYNRADLIKQIQWLLNT